jgi:RAT1-interacting protein
MQSLDVRAWMASHPPEACAGVDVAQPVLVPSGGWSRGSGGSYLFGACVPPALALPPLPLDLNDGLDTFVPKADASCGVEVVVRAALAAGTAAPDGCRVLSFRNNLNKIVGTTLSPTSAWTVDACLLGATLFLDVVPTPESWESGADQARYVAWGYSFEAHCTGAAVADANTECGALVRARLGAHRLLMGAEIDCYDPGVCSAAGGGAPPPLSSFREVKTCRQPTHRGQWRTMYKHRHPKWWVQSFLAGVTHLVLGFRDDGGVVQQVDVVPVSELPRRSWQAGERWSPQQALAFGESCLGWMRAAAEQHQGRQLRFTYDPERAAVAAAPLPGGDLPARLEAVLAGG